MANKIIAGDFEGCEMMLTFGILSIYKKGVDLNLDKTNVESVELVTEENKKKFVGAAGWGLVGAALLGPAGLIAGALFGGNRKEVCFACTLKDGRRFMAVADSKIYQKLLSYCFR